MSDANAIPQWFSGSEHTHRVAAAIAQYGPIARTTLAQMLGLSQGALSRITSDLIYAGVIEELPAEAGPSGKLPERFTPRESSDRRGRPQTSLVLCSNARTFIGVKVHGMSPRHPYKQYDNCLQAGCYFDRLCLSALHPLRILYP